MLCIGCKNTVIMWCQGVCTAFLWHLVSACDANLFVLPCFFKFLPSFSSLIKTCILYMHIRKLYLIYTCTCIHIYVNVHVCLLLLFFLTYAVRSSGGGGMYKYFYIICTQFVHVGCAVLLCLVVLFDLALFFLPSFSHLSLKHV